MSFFTKVEKFFLPVFIIAIVVGLTFPTLSMFSFAAPFMIAVAIFLSSLKVDFKLFFNYLKEFKYFAKKFLIIKIIAPLTVFFATDFFAPHFALGGLLVVAIPSGMTNIIYSDIFKGNNALTLLFTVVSHLLSPLLIPLLVFLVLFQSISFDYVNLFLSLAAIVLVPVFMAYLVKRKFAEKIEKVKENLSGINILLVASIVMIIIAQNAERFSDIYSLLLPVIYVLIILTAMCFFGFFLTRKEPRENKITISLSTFHTNIVLGLFIASTYFSFEVLLIMIAAQLVIDVYQAFYKILLDKFVG